MPFLALQYIYTSTCTEPDTHALIKKLINLVSQFNKHLIINCFRFNYFCPNILKIYILSGFLQIYITFWFFFPNVQLLMHCSRLFCTLLKGLIVQITVGCTTVSITPPEITVQNLVLSSLLLLYCICYSCQIYQSGTDLCVYRAGFLFLLTVKE